MFQSGFPDSLSGCDLEWPGSVALAQREVIGRETTTNVKMLELISGMSDANWRIAKMAGKLLSLDVVSLCWFCIGTYLAQSWSGSS